MVSASDVKPDLTILADVAANVFALCLLILLTLLAVAGRAREAAPVALSGPIEARETFDVVERAPLGARAMIAHLRARLALDGGLSVDVLPERLALAVDGRGVPGDGPEALAAALRGADPRRPVRLYVFDAARYGTAMAALRTSRHAFEEISVPRALRRQDGGGWSPAFLALAPQAADPDRFRAGLARLLGGGDRQVGPGATPSPSGGTGRAPTLTERLSALFSGFAAFAVPVLALAAVLFIEARERRRLALPPAFPGARHG